MSLRTALNNLVDGSGPGAKAFQTVGVICMMLGLACMVTAPILGVLLLAIQVAQVLGWMLTTGITIISALMLTACVSFLIRWIDG